MSQIRRDRCHKHVNMNESLEWLSYDDSQLKTSLLELMFEAGTRNVRYIRHQLVRDPLVNGKHKTAGIAIHGPTSA